MPIDDKLKRMPRTVRVGVVPGGLSEFITIQAAIDWCNTQAQPVPSATAPYVVEVWPGIYDEQVTLADFVDLKGLGPEGAVVIQQTDATILFSGDNCEVNNVTLRLVTPTAGRNLFDDNGQAHAMVFDRVRWEITTPGALLHHLIDVSGGSTIALKRCYYAIGGTGGSIGIYSDTAISAFLLEDNNFGMSDNTAFHVQIVGVNTTMVGGGNRWAGACGWMSANNGTVVFNGDAVVCTGGNNIVGGSICLKNGRQQYEVYEGMWVQHAITAAAADTPAPAAGYPYTILVHSGIYTEQITCQPWVNLMGIGQEAVIIRQTDGQVVVLSSNIQMENLSLIITTPSAGRDILVDSGGAVTGVLLRQILFGITTPGAFAHRCVRFINVSTARLERCYWSTGGAGGMGLSVETNIGTITVVDCDLAWTSATGRVISCASAGSVITIVNSRLAGLGTHLYCSAGTIRVSNSQYRSIIRTGAANIVDESPELKDAPWKVHKWNWMVALACADVAVRGTPVDAGSGQVMLEVTDNVAGQEAVETNTEVAGSLGNEFTPARTPRFITQISVDSFDAHVTAFFGLRATLGNSVPVAGEHHAGFDWNGTNFRAINGDGAAQQATNLTTPSTGTQHQLEVVVIGGVQVEFYVDGVLVHTETSNLPTAGMDWQHLLVTAGAGGGDLVQVTVRNGGCQECPS